MASSFERLTEIVSSAPAVAQPPKLLDRLRDHLRTPHYSIRAEAAYVDSARRFILFHGKRHPQEMGGAEVEAFLTYLAVARQVSASTQNQARAAILYLSKQALGVDLPWRDDVVQAKTPKRLQVRADGPRGARFAAGISSEIPAAGPRCLSRLAPPSTHSISRLLEQHGQ